MMSEDKPRATDRDRSPLLAGEDYEVRYLSEQTGLSPEQARILIRRYGNDREKLMQEAKVMWRLVARRSQGNRPQSLE
jgi:hypothetical protein